MIEVTLRFRDYHEAALALARLGDRAAEQEHPSEAEQPAALKSRRKKKSDPAVREPAPVAETAPVETDIPEAPVSEPAPQEPEDEVTYGDVCDALKVLVGTKGRTAGRDMLDRFGVIAAAKLEKSQYLPFVKACAEASHD